MFAPSVVIVIDPSIIRVALLYWWYNASLDCLDRARVQVAAGSINPSAERPPIVRPACA